MVGQGMWCFAHSLWMGNSFVLVTSLFLMLHHIFGYAPSRQQPFNGRLS
jgi:uncharacterized membrane protein